MKNNEYKSLQHLLGFVQKETNQRLDSFFTQKVAEARQVDPSYRTLLEDMQKFVLRGGKRLRPTLAVLGYQASGGKDLGGFMDAATALEVFHNFVLIHDDVMDGDSRRYNGPNMVGIYERRWASRLPTHKLHKVSESVAIMAGELNESFVFEMINDTNYSPQTKLKLMRHINNVFLQTAGGQFLDVTMPTKKRPTLASIEKVNYYKTAQYSIVGPLCYGLIAAGGNTKLTNQFEKYGNALGVAYQLTDDLLGMFGSERTIGKPVVSDLREGKQTVLIHYARQLSSPSQWRIIERSLGNPKVSREDLKVVRTILEECGARAKVAVRASEYLQTAQQTTSTMAISTELKALLNDLAQFCVKRSS